MSVKINVASFSYEHTNGRKVVETRGSTVGGCLGDLVSQFPGLAEALFEQDGKLRDHLHIYVNNEPVYPVEMARPVRDGDELHIVRMTSGG
ncbi:MAG: MoaD/ThiS family protein [Dehalococcoidia bacterium]|nr:MoaD/ThiS family protein [Dehalococcoidia bacterium]